MGKPTTCNDPTCDQTHPKGCVGHVEDCTACGWRGRNYLDEPCRKCGGEVQRRPCTQHARKGMTVCNSHGGNAPQNVHAAERREQRQLARAQAERTIRDVGITEINDPLEVLAQITAEMVAIKDFFAANVGDLNDLTVETFGGGRDAHVYVKLWLEAMKTAQRFLTDWTRLGFDEKRLEMDQVRTARIVAFIRGVLADHGIDPATEETRQIMRTWQPVLRGDPPPT